MKKIFVLAALVIGLLITSKSQAFAAATCGEIATHGKCGVESGCADDQICIVQWGWNNGECKSTAAGTTYAGQCANRVPGTGPSCGYNSFTNQWCGRSGGCADGYMCDSTSKTCVKQAACDNTSAEYSKQCGNFGSGTAGQCGPIGACAVGYRCVTDSSSPFGYSCQQKPDSNGLMCDGTTVPITPEQPQTPTNPTNPQTPTNPTVPQTPTTPTDTNDQATGGNLDIFNGPTSEDFKSLDPLRQSFADSSVTNAYFTSPAGIISRVLLFAFPIAGLILFVMLVWAGFQILAGASQGSKSIEAGKQRATTAIVGFILLFVAYWIMQIIEIVFSIQIL